MILAVMNATYAIAHAEAWKIQDFNWVWTRDLAIPVQRSNQLSYEVTDVRGLSFVGSNEPVRNECEVINERFHTSNYGKRFIISWLRIWNSHPQFNIWNLSLITSDTIAATRKCKRHWCGVEYERLALYKMELIVDCLYNI